MRLPPSSARWPRRPSTSCAASTRSPLRPSTGSTRSAPSPTFLHAARLGIFELSWNVLCPGCGGVLETGSTLRTVDHDAYNCALCARAYEPTLDEMVEVTFTVAPRVRRIAAHNPDDLPAPEYFRQIFWGSGIDLPEELDKVFEEITLESIELPAGERAVLSLQLPAEFLIVFDPVTHATQFLDVKGEPTRERQSAVDGVQRGAHAQRDRYDAPGTVAHLAREPPATARLAGRVGRGAIRCTICWRGAARSSRPSASSPTRRSATSTAPRRSTSRSGSRSRASPSCSPICAARPSFTSGSAISSPTISCRRISASCSRSSRRKRARW